MIKFPRLENMPREARLWLYASDRSLTEEEAGRVQGRMDEFFLRWSSHGRTVVGAAEIAERRIVAIVAHVPEGDISGCGIDKSVHVLDELAAEMGLAWTSGLSIAYRDSVGEICLMSRPEFRAAVRSGSIHGDTTVIDLSASELADLTELGIERQASSSWHAAVFDIEGESEVV